MSRSQTPASGSASLLSTRCSLPSAAFPPDSAVRRVTRQRAVLLYGPAALALQVSHPLVAAGVREYSDFAANPLARLHRTLDATYRSVFDPPADADSAVRHVNRLHANVMGELNGRPYRALDPDLLLWVAATLVMGGVAAHERFLSPLATDEKAAFYHDMRLSTARFGLPLKHGPQAWDEFEAYWHEAIHHPEFATDPVSREVAWQITSPTRPLWLRPAAPFARWWLADTLPPHVAERLGFRRTRLSTAAARVMSTAATVGLRRGPRFVRIVSYARRAEARERQSAAVESAAPPAMLGGDADG